MAQASAVAINGADRAVSEAGHGTDSSLEVAVPQRDPAQVAASERVPSGRGPVGFRPELRHNGEILRRTLRGGTGSAAPVWVGGMREAWAAAWATPR